MYSFWVRTVGLSKYIMWLILYFISDIYILLLCFRRNMSGQHNHGTNKTGSTGSPKKRHLKSSFELFMGFWVYQWPTQWLRLGRLVGDARFVNEWKIETAEPTKTRVLEVVGCFSVMFVWEGWYFPPRLRTCKVPTSAWEIRSFTDARWMCLEPQPSEYSRGTWHLCIFPSKDGWEWWWPCVND